ncbi:MAG: ABC transporter permease [Nanohaloarchaea archaeon]|nr:ABC transporter permease [Candidatus Nanohaloarchaea archaeon]
MLLDFLKLAYRNIRHRDKRSWLTIIGTLIGIMAVVSLISIGQGLQTSIEDEFKDIGADKVYVSPGGGSVAERFSGTAAKLDEDDIETIRRTRGVDIVEGRVSGSLIVEIDDETSFRQIFGVDPDSDLMKQTLDIGVSEGRYLRSTGSSGVVVGQSIAEDQDLEPRSRIEINGNDYRVVGVSKSSSNRNVDSGIVMAMEEARELLDRPESFGSINVKVQEGYTPSEVEEDIEKNLRNERDLEEGEEDFTTNTAEDLIRSLNNQLSIVRGVLLGIGSISLLVGAVGIMNTMYTSVTERTREIGVMKAIGATKRQILTLFLIESGAIGLVGGAMGATIGIGLSWAATSVISSQLGIGITAYVGLELILGSLFFSFIVGMVSGVLPALKASRLEPAEAIRHG